MHEPRPLATERPVTFAAPRSDFERLATRGALFELLTLGFYRFWLTTDLRRHLWSNTAVDGDAAEYTGTAKELLLGFLFALAILMPVYLAYFLVGIEAERWQAFASVPLFVFFYLFAQFARYRARRYRLTRTVWRGVRFGMGGSGLAYVLRFSLWTLLGLLTLGLALPWRQAALERYKMRHTSYGTLAGRFEGTGWELLKQIWWLWAVGLAVLGGFALAAVTPLAFLTFPATLIALPFCYAAYRAIEWRWWIAGVRLGELSFESTLGGGALIGLYWKAIGWCVLLLFGVGAWATTVLGLAVLFTTHDGSLGKQVLSITQLHVSVPILIGLGYLVAAVTAGIFLRIYLMRGLWVRMAESATVHDLAAAESTLAGDRLTSAVGEGLADGLDLGGF